MKMNNPLRPIVFWLDDALEDLLWVSWIILQLVADSLTKLFEMMSDVLIFFWNLIVKR